MRATFPAGPCRFDGWRHDPCERTSWIGRSHHAGNCRFHQREHRVDSDGELSRMQSMAAASRLPREATQRDGRPGSL